MTTRLTHKKTLAIALALVFISVLVVGAIPPARANLPPPWTVLLDANSTSNLDASPQTTFAPMKTFNIGAILNASSNGPTTCVAPCNTAGSCSPAPQTCLQHVFGFQYSIVYDNTSFVPQG